MKTKKDKRPLLQKEMDDILIAMQNIDSTEDPKYKALLDTLERLKYLEANEPKKNKVSADTMATVAGNLLGIAIIVGFEHGHALTSKAVSMLIKGRV